MVEITVTQSEFVHRVFAPREEGGAGARMLGLGEMHGDAGTLQLVNNTIPELKAANTKHLLVELPIELNPWFEAHLKGEISDDKLRGLIKGYAEVQRFSEQVVQLGETIILAQHNGIAAHGIDSRLTLFQGPKSPEWVAENCDWYQRNYNSPSMQNTLAIIKAGLAEGKPSDVVSAQIAAGFLGDGERAVLIHGNVHFAGGGDHCIDVNGNVLIRSPDDNTLLIHGVLAEALNQAGYPIYDTSVRESAWLSNVSETAYTVARGLENTGAFFSNLIGKPTAYNLGGCTSHISDAHVVLDTGAPTATITLNDEQLAAGKALVFAGLKMEGNADPSEIKTREPASPSVFPVPQLLLGEKLRFAHVENPHAPVKPNLDVSVAAPDSIQR